jgi:hypothetical protein
MMMICSRTSFQLLTGTSRGLPPGGRDQQTAFSRTTSMAMLSAVLTTPLPEQPGQSL